MQSIENKTWTKDKKDIWVWKDDEKLEYMVNSAYGMLRNEVSEG